MPESKSRSEPKLEEDGVLDDLVEYLLDELEDNLHWVVTADKDDGLEHTVHYLNTDVQEDLYGNSDRREIAQEMVFNSIEEKYLRDLYELGESRFSVEYFEDATILKPLVGEDSTKSVAVGVESTHSMDHTSVALECLEMLENG